MSGAWEEQPAKLLHHYDRTAQHAAHQIIRRYSNSFSLASNLLRGHVKTDIRNLYAVVRIADEIVDGAGYGAGLDTSQCQQLLDHYERQVLAAPHQRLHIDPVLHAYAISARRCEFKDEYLSAFVASMRRVLSAQSGNKQREFDDYIYGSAAVIGMLCPQAIFAGDNPTQDARDVMEHGACTLGVALQKTNYLRNIANESHSLCQSYAPKLEEQELDETLKAEL